MLRAQVLAKGATLTSTASIALSSTKPLVQINASPLQSSLSLTPANSAETYFVPSVVACRARARAQRPTPPTCHPALSPQHPPYITPGNKEDAAREGVEQSQRCKRCLVAKLGLDSERHLLQIYRAGRGSEGSAYDGGTRTYMLQRKHSDLFVYSSRIRATATVHNLI